MTSVGPSLLNAAATAQRVAAMNGSLIFSTVANLEVPVIGNFTLHRTMNWTYSSGLQGFTTLVQVGGKLAMRISAENPTNGANATNSSSSSSNSSSSSAGSSEAIATSTSTTTLTPTVDGNLTLYSKLYPGPGFTGYYQWSGTLFMNPDPFTTLNLTAVAAAAAGGVTAATRRLTASAAAAADRLLNGVSGGGASSAAGSVSPPPAAGAAAAACPAGGGNGGAEYRRARGKAAAVERGKGGAGGASIHTHSDRLRAEAPAGAAALYSIADTGSSWGSSSASGSDQSSSSSSGGVDAGMRKHESIGESSSSCSMEDEQPSDRSSSSGGGGVTAEPWRQQQLEPGVTGRAVLATITAAAGGAELPVHGVIRVTEWSSSSSSSGSSSSSSGSDSAAKDDGSIFVTGPYVSGTGVTSECWGVVMCSVSDTQAGYPESDGISGAGGDSLGRMGRGGVGAGGLGLYMWLAIGLGGGLVGVGAVIGFVIIAKRRRKKTTESTGKIASGSRVGERLAVEDVEDKQQQQQREGMQTAANQQEQQEDDKQEGMGLVLSKLTAKTSMEQLKWIEDDSEEDEALHGLPHPVLGWPLLVGRSSNPVHGGGGGGGGYGLRNRQRSNRRSTDLHSQHVRPAEDLGGSDDCAPEGSSDDELSAEVAAATAAAGSRMWLGDHARGVARTSVDGDLRLSAAGPGAMGDQQQQRQQVVVAGNEGAGGGGAGGGGLSRGSWMGEGGGLEVGSSLGNGHPRLCLQQQQQAPVWLSFRDGYQQQQQQVGDDAVTQQQQQLAGYNRLQLALMTPRDGLEDISTSSPVSPSNVATQPRRVIGAYSFGAQIASAPAVTNLSAAGGAVVGAGSDGFGAQPLQGRMSVVSRSSAVYPAPLSSSAPARSSALLPSTEASLNRRKSRSLDILTTSQQQQQGQMLVAPAAAAAGRVVVGSVWGGAGGARRHSTGSITPAAAATTGSSNGGTVGASIWLPNLGSTGTATAAMVDYAGGGSGGGSQRSVVAWGGGGSATAGNHVGEGVVGGVSGGSSLPGMVEVEGGHEGGGVQGGAAVLRHGAELTRQGVIFGAAGGGVTKPHVRSSCTSVVSHASNGQ